MDKIQVTITPGVTVLIDTEMLGMLNDINEHSEVYHQNLTLHQQALVAKLTAKTILIKRRKNGKLSYRVRHGVSWQ